MSTFVREQRVEAKQWIASDIEQHAEMWAYRIIDWVNALGGEARYWPGSGDPHHESAPAIRIRTRDGWVSVAPGDYVEMGAEFWTREHPMIQNAKQNFREFIVRNAAYFSEASGWKVTS